MDETRNRTAPPRTPGKKRKTRNPVQMLARAAVDAVLDKKGLDVVVMDLRGISGVADFFVICTGGSDTQIKALSEAVRDHIRETAGEKPWHVEGHDHYQWVLLDYVDLVVHIFNHEKRGFYDLERLWGDAGIEHVPDNGNGADVRVLNESSSERAS